MQIHKKIYCVVLVFLISLITSFNFTFGLAEKKSEVLAAVEKLFDEGNYDGALILTDDFIYKYKNEVKERKKEFCQAYYIRAKIYFDCAEDDKMKIALYKLYNITPYYELPRNEAEDFRGAALNVQQRIRQLQYDKDLGDIKKEKEKYCVTISIKDLTHPIYVSFDKIEGLGTAFDPLKEKNIKKSFDKKGKHKIYFKHGNLYIAEEFEIISKDSSFHYILDFDKYGKRLQ
jgi:hypothetical protein